MTIDYWHNWIEYIEPIYETHGADYALKLMRECEKRFFDERAGRFEIYDLRPSTVFDDREAYKAALYKAIHEATQDIIRTKSFVIERIAS